MTKGSNDYQHMNPTRMRGVVAALALSFFFVANADAQPGARGASGLSDAQAEKLLALSAEFDRVYIPALALTNQQKQEPSEVAIARFREKGSAITREAISVLGLQPEDSGLWPAIQKAIDEAEELIREGQLMQAHEELEPLRAMLAADRRRLGVCYPLDLLNDYHETMEAIVKPATEATPADVDGSYRARLGELAVEASARWARIEQTGFAADYFQISGAQRRSLDQAIADEWKALGKLNRALRDGDGPAVLEAARGLKPPFARAYMLFGDFRGLENRHWTD